MVYRIRLAVEAARQHGWRGTRRRVCTFSDGSRRLVFSRVPIDLAELPPEVAADPYLIVTEIPSPAAVAPEARAAEPRQAVETHTLDAAGSTPAPATTPSPKPGTKKRRQPRW